MSSSSSSSSSRSSSSLHGDKSDPAKPKPGLIGQLSKRVGLLCQLVKLLPKNKFKILVDGIFMSKLMYCLQLFGNVWGIETMEDTETRQSSFTKSNLRSLQVLQNKVLRLMTGCGYNTHNTELFEKSGMLSVNQLIAYTTLVSIFKVKLSGKPQYLADRLGVFEQHDMVNNRRNGNVKKIYFRLGRGREGMLYQGSKLFNSLDPSLRMETKVTKFKQKVKEWIRRKIPQIPY